MNELISIIVPIYKVERYLSRCIDSIIQQSYKNIEVILIDDGSPDNCGDICDEYAKKDNRIQVIHKKNGGLSDARNVGIQHSHGDFIAFIDSDDYVSDKYIERMYRSIQSHSADICICSFEYVDEKGISIPNMNHSPIINQVITQEEAISKLFDDYYWYYVVAWNKLYRKSLFLDLSFVVGKIHEDEFIIHSLFLNCNHIVTIEDPLYFYVQREDSIMGSRMNSIREFDTVEAELERAIALYEHQYIYWASKSYYNAVLRYSFLYRNTSKSLHFNDKCKFIRGIANRNKHLASCCTFEEKALINLILTCPQLYKYIIKVRSRLKNETSG